MKGRQMNSSLRADIYKCYIDGNTQQEAAGITGAKESYINKVYLEFSIKTGVIYANRLEQIKHIEEQLFWAIENTTNKHLIQRLQNSYSKFCL